MGEVGLLVVISMAKINHLAKVDATEVGHERFHQRETGSHDAKIDFKTASASVPFQRKKQGRPKKTGQARCRFSSKDRDVPFCK